LTRAWIVLVPILLKETLTPESICESSVTINVIQRDFRLHGIDRNTMWWQQDGAPSHTSNATM
jgi:hypothetical protein